MPSHSPRLPPMTEIIVHMLMPVDTVVETSSLHTMGLQFVSLQFKKAAKILTAEAKLVKIIPQ